MSNAARAFRSRRGLKRRRRLAHAQSLKDGLGSWAKGVEESADLHQQDPSHSA